MNEEATKLFQGNFFKMINQFQYLESQTELFQDELFAYIYQDSFEVKKFDIISLTQNQKNRLYKISIQNIKLNQAKAAIISFHDVTQIYEYQESKIQLDLENKYKMMLIRSIGHHLRHPITNIFHLINKINISLQNQKQNFKQTLEQNLQLISSSANEILLMVNNFKDFVDIQNNSFQLQNEEFTFKDLLKEIKGNLKQEISENRIKIQTIFVNINRFQVIEGDRNRIRNVITKLLQNSIKYSQTNSKITITIKFSQTLKEENSPVDLKIKIEDEGVGIHQQRQQKILELFGDLNTLNELPSANIGLPICNTIVKQLNRSASPLKVKSKQGAIISFFVTVKLVEEQFVLESHREQKLIVPDFRTLMLHQVKCQCPELMIVDDTPLIRLTLTSLFENTQIKYIEAQNGKECISLYEAQLNRNCCLGIKVIIMDCQMPIMNGWDATIKLRQLGFKGSIIGYTAYTHQSDIQACIDAGMTLVLEKPTAFEKIMEKVMQSL